MILVVAIGFTSFPAEYLSHYRRFDSLPSISFAAVHSLSADILTEKLFLN